MRKTSHTFTIIAAITAMALTCSRAQPAPSNPNDSSARTQTSKSGSAKQLTATGRMNEPAIRASKLVGAQVIDRSGNRAAQIQDIIVNPRSGHVDFALLSLTSANANGNLVPVPWKILRPSAAQYGVSSDQPVFTLNADKSKLARAPTVSSSDLEQSQWRQRIYAYYGVTPPPATGNADFDQEEVKGEGARSLKGHNAEATPPPSTTSPENQ